ILLKFEKLRQVLAYIKAVFGSHSGGSAGLNFDGLKSALNVLHGPMEKDEILELFEFVDLDDSKVIEFKEFLVALTV
ncbi:CML22, partial [Symbiodinium microadriaticum]